MTFERVDDSWGGMLGFIIAALVGHLLLALALHPLLPEPDEESDESDASNQDFEVGVVEDPDLPESQPPEKLPEPQEKPESPETQQSQDEPEPKRQRNRKTVDQQTNAKNPDEAKFRSNEANRVDKERRARETTNQNRPPGRDKPGEEAEKEVQSGAESPRAGLKAKAPDSKQPRPPDSPRPPPKPDASRDSSESSKKAPDEPTRPDPSTSESKPSPKPSEDSRESTSQKRAEDTSSDRPNRPLPMPSASDYDKIFEDTSKKSNSRARAQKGVGHEMFQRIEKSQGSLQATLENYITEVQPGNHTAVNAKVDKAASYINTIHRKIHPRWGGDYLPSLASRFGPSHPMNDPDLNAELEFVIDGKTGELTSVNIVDSSGKTMFDSEAILISEEVAPHPKPPEAIVSPDGNVYMHWNFWRDQRQCGTFGVSIYRVDQQGRKQSASN